MNKIRFSLSEAFLWIGLFSWFLSTIFSPTVGDHPFSPTFDPAIQAIVLFTAMAIGLDWILRPSPDVYRKLFLGIGAGIVFTTIVGIGLAVSISSWFSFLPQFLEVAVILAIVGGSIGSFFALMIAIATRFARSETTECLGIYVTAFLVGWYFFVEKLSHANIEAEGATIVLILGAFATAAGMMLVALLGLPIRCSSALNLWWRSRRWPPIAAIGTASLLFGLAWHPALHASVADPRYSDIYVNSYNRPLGLCAWLLLLFGIMNYTRRREIIPAPSTPPDGPITFEEAS